MMKFIVVQNKTVPAPYDTWADSLRFKSRGDTRTHQGREYKLFAKKEKIPSVGKRIFAFAIAFFSLGFALISKNIRQLCKGKITKKFAVTENLDPYWSTAATRFKYRNRYEIEITKNAIKNDPERFLKYFYTLCFLKDKTCNSFIFTLLNDDLSKIDSHDAGGISRDCITTLFEALIEKKFNTKRKNGPIPIGSYTGFTNVERMYYQAIGKIMSMALNGNTFLIGQVFDPAIYEVIHAIPNSRIEFEKLSDSLLLQLYRILEKNNDNTLLQLLDENNINEETAQRMFDNAYFELDGSDRPKALKGNPSIDLITKHIIDVKKTLRSLVLDNAKRDLQAIFQIAKGLNYRRTHTPNELMLRIQGDFSKEKLKRILICPSQKTRVFFQKWIDESSEKMCIDFVQAATGSRVLSGSGIRIGFNLSKNQRPQYHTCLQSVDFYEYFTYELFKERLEESIVNALHGPGFHIR